MSNDYNNDVSLTLKVNHRFEVLRMSHGGYVVNLNHMGISMRPTSAAFCELHEALKWAYEMLCDDGNLTLKRKKARRKARHK